MSEYNKHDRDGKRFDHPKFEDRSKDLGLDRVDEPKLDELKRPNFENRDPEIIEVDRIEYVRVDGLYVEKGADTECRREVRIDRQAGVITTEKLITLPGMTDVITLWNDMVSAERVVLLSLHANNTGMSSVKVTGAPGHKKVTIEVTNTSISAFAGTLVIGFLIV